jgi:dTDP-4-amino-4,6-dideoxygalactose transaminase
MKTIVPFLDLITPHVELEEELVQVFRKALHTAGFIGGDPVRNFEEHFASYCGADECVGVASGTDALLLAFLAGGVKPGDTVLTVANTFIATAEAITQAGAVPEFIDIEKRTCTIDVGKLRSYLEGCALDPLTGKRLSQRTGNPITAVVPVHLFGQMAEMDAIMEIAEEFGLQVYEDACQAHGAKYYSQREGRWLTAGSVGKAAAFSFYPGKNLGACGEAGAITTNDPEIARKVRVLRDHGQPRKYFHDAIGYNGRLDAIQAGFLDVKLKHLPRWTEQRRTVARAYDRMLSGINGIVVPHERKNSEAVYHLYVVRVEDRDIIQEKLAERGIGTGIHYPIPLHLQPAYAFLGYAEGDLPVTEAAAATLLSLPMYPGLSLEDQEYVIEALSRSLEENTPIASALAG